MENATPNGDVNLLLDVLAHGKEHVRELEAHLNESGLGEKCKLLAQQVESTLKTAIAMAKMISCEAADSPWSPSGSGSPPSYDSERAWAFKEHERREMSKKRKTLPKWTSKVCISSGGGAIEGSPDDGYSWRKYGQKDILGAKFPRGYYRCTHRNAHGCLATKQVQRSDDDPSVFDVTYRGHHTCVRSRRPATAEPSPREPDHITRDLTFTAGLKVETAGMAPSSSSLSFPSTPVNGARPESNGIFSPSTTESNLAGSFSPTFIPSTISESNHFPVSPLNEIISAANSPMVDIGFMLEHVDFERTYPFDHSNFFR
ncbi:uncharacterized protein [Typha latifolia]|uniref:uncharacterized protein n=1 Tax=Typha latifolia TaxID=4733 RepID=UPI003C2D8743